MGDVCEAGTEPKKIFPRETAEFPHSEHRKRTVEAAERVIQENSRPDCEWSRLAGGGTASRKRVGVGLRVLFTFGTREIQVPLQSVEH